MEIRAGGGVFGLGNPGGRGGHSDPGNPGGRGSKNLAIRRGGVDFFWNNPVGYWTIYVVILCSSRKTKKKTYPPHGRSLEIPKGREDLRARILEAVYEDKLEFPGRRRVAKQKTFCGGSIDIFWNCTLYTHY